MVSYCLFSFGVDVITDTNVRFLHTRTHGLFRNAEGFLCCRLTCFWPEPTIKPLAQILASMSSRLCWCFLTTCMIIVQFANIYMFTVTAQMIYLPFCVRQTRYRKVSPRGSFVFEKFRVSSEARVCAYSRIKKP